MMRITYTLHSGFSGDSSSDGIRTSPTADNESLVNAQTMKKIDSLDTAHAPLSENDCESPVSSSEQEDITEGKRTSTPGHNDITQALAEEDTIAECSENINNEEGIRPEIVSYGARPRLLSETEPDIIMNYVQSELQRAPRYFDPPGCSLPSSNEPGENDVEYEKRKKHKRKKRCYNCGNKGHEGKKCKKHKCLICSMKGHLITDCPLKNAEVDSPSRLCLKCGSTGHDMFSCSNDYSSEDLKGIRCYICNEFGHLCCVNNPTEGTSEASCYHCGQSGHFGSDCIKLKEATEALALQVCSKCGQSGHIQQLCIGKHEGGKAKKKKPRKPRERRISVPSLNANQYQANIAGHWYRPPTVGPYYGKPGSNVWLSPTASAARGIVSHQNGGTQVFQNSSHPMTRSP